MSMFDIIRAQGVGATEAVESGMTVVITQGDRVVCDQPFTEVSSITRIDNNLHIIVTDNPPILFNQFFSAQNTIIQFTDKQISSDELNKLLTVHLSSTDLYGNEHQISLLPGSLIVAQVGDNFYLDAKEFNVKNLHRHGEDLLIQSHDETPKTIAKLSGFFTKPEAGMALPQLHIVDPAAGTTQEMIVHPHSNIFQWEGEPLPTAVVGSLYGYYFQLQGADADKFILVAKTADGELPSWMTFSHVEHGKYYLGGIPTTDAVGTHEIFIQAYSTQNNIGFHTQQSFELMIRLSDDPTTRTTVDDVATAEFRSLNEVLIAENYVTGVLTIDQMPYMSMPEIAVITAFSAINPAFINQMFSTYATADQIAHPGILGAEAMLGGAQALEIDLVRNHLLAGEGVGNTGSHILIGTNIIETSIVTSTEGLSETGLVPTGGKEATIPLTNQESTATPATSEMMMVSTTSPTTQTLLPFLILNPPVTFPEFHGIVDLPIYMDGVHGFKITITSGFNSQNATIIQDGDGFGNLLVGTYNNASPYSRATYIPGQSSFPANSPFTNPALNMTSFNNDFSFSPIFSSGASVASVSDFNGDGILDFLIAPVDGNPAFIVSGSSSALPSSVALSSLGYGMYTINSATKVGGAYFSTSGALGDADGDGFGDVILGSPSGGQAYVIFSNAEIFANFNVSYISLFGNYGIHITGLGIANNAFNNVTGVNFNGDEFNDIFVGFTDNISDIGSIGVIFGGTGLHGDTVSVSSAGVSGASGFLIVNSAAMAADYLAMPTNIGNFTGSGFDDIAIASKNTVYVIFGDTSFTPGSTFDVNTLNGSNGFSLTSSQPGAHITSVSYVGDVNGDGVSDFAFVDSSAFSGSGAIFVIFGSHVPFSSNIDYTTLDQNQGFVIKDASGILSNATIGGGGDLNGDGLSDIVITAGGNVFTVFGSNFSNTITDMGTQGSDVITVSSGENVIFGGAGNDIITGGDNSDYIDGGMGADTINAGQGVDTIVYDSADILVNGGPAPDVLWFKYDHTHADLRGTLVISGIDVINLTPLITLTGNSIILDAATVTAMSDENSITIYGNAHDKVTIMAADNWVTTAGSGFTTYTAHSGALITIQDSIDVYIQPRMLGDYIDGMHGFALDAPPTYFYTLGWGVALVKDINGDGFGELLTANRTFYNEAKADIIFGQSSLPSAHFQVTDPGVMGTQFFTGTGFLGGFVAGINDFNGDGYNDIFIPPKQGYHAYIVYGDPSGFAPSVNLPTQGTAGLDIFTTASGVGAYFTTGAALGDVNGDGLGDVGVANGRAGNVFVVFGNLSPSTSIDVSTLNGTNGFNIFTPGAAGNSDSAALAGVDINGDGFTDILSKTTSTIPNQTYISVILGHSSSFAPTVNTSTLVPGTGFHFFNSAYNTGYNALGRFGLANLGDINGSGIDAVGMHGSVIFQHTSTIGNAAAYIVFGDPTFSTSGNFDLTTLNGSNGFGLVAPGQNFSYITSISAAGDFNGDGIADFAFIDAQSFGTGALFVIFGSTDPMPGLIDYLHLTSNQGVAFQFSGVYGGFSVGGGADFNGDGLSDIVVGNPFAYAGATANGTANIIFGGDFSNSITQLGTSGNDNITATGGDDNIVAGQGNDIINALAGNDLINGGSGADIIDAGADNDRIIFDANDSSVNGGTGLDTLWFKDDGTLANLVGTTVFIGIDIIDLHPLQTLTGNEVTLDAATVASMSDANVLTVNGNAHDALTLIATDIWAASSVIPGYITYTSVSGTVVNVENAVHVTFAPPAAPVHLNYTLSTLVDGVHGFSLTSTADFSAVNATIMQNGDGFGDLLIGSHRNFSTTNYINAVQIHGQASFNASTPLVDLSLNESSFKNDTVNSPQNFYIIYPVAVSDFNGDGINDFLLSSFYGYPSILVLGHASGFPTNVPISGLGSSAVTLINTLGNYNNTSAALGDVNGDGLSDIIISNSRGSWSAVIFGTQTPGTSIDTALLNGSDGFVINRVNSYVSLNFQDVGGGDVTGDGLNDIFVSFWDQTTLQAGVGVILGNNVAFNPTVTVGIGGITGASGFIITDSTATPGFSDRLVNPTNIGDFNGNGIDDIALSSQDKVYVIFGDTSLASATTFDLATLNGTNGFTLVGAGSDNITSMAYLGDVNGDGLPDFDFVDSGAYAGAGAVYVIFGTHGAMPATINLTTLTSDQGFVITDPSINLSNASLGGGGDINGDGLSDITITSGGNVYTVFGNNFNGAITQMGTANETVIQGVGSNDVIYAGSADHTIIGGTGFTFIDSGTGHDIINGGTGMNTIVYSALDISVDAGIGGPNTLWLENDGILADFQNTTIFKDFDVIDLRPLQSLKGNEVDLNPLGVSNMSHNNTLQVEGGAHDFLVLHNDGADVWSVSATNVNIGGFLYTQYTSAVTNSTVYAENTLNHVSVV